MLRFVPTEARSRTASSLPSRLQKNIEREALTDYETTKARLAEIRQIEAKMKDEAKKAKEADAKEVLAAAAPRPPSKGGRPKKKASKRNVAAETGTQRKTIDKIEQQVELAERFPFLQRSTWGREQTLKQNEERERIQPGWIKNYPRWEFI